MDPELESLVARLIEGGRDDVVAGMPVGLEAGLATLRFAESRLRRGADRLCQEAAATCRRSGASWRQIGEAVGGITPQGAGAPLRQSRRRREKIESIQGRVGGKGAPVGGTPLTTCRSAHRHAGVAKLSGMAATSCDPW